MVLGSQGFTSSKIHKQKVKTVSLQAKLKQIGEKPAQVGSYTQANTHHCGYGSNVLTLASLSENFLAISFCLMNYFHSNSLEHF